MAPFRKKPLVIDAEQWHPNRQVTGVCTETDDNVHGHHHGAPVAPHIHTLEGDHLVSAGDWIITGIKGERYPCKPDIFEATYERAD